MSAGSTGRCNPHRVLVGDILLDPLRQQCSLVSIRLIDESAHSQSSITNSALFYDLRVTFSHNLGQFETFQASIGMPCTGRSMDQGDACNTISFATTNVRSSGRIRARFGGSDSKNVREESDDAT